MSDIVRVQGPLPATLHETPEDLKVIAELRVQLHANGNVTIGGHIGNLSGSLELLDHAKDAVRRYHKQLQDGKRLVIPEYDTTMPKPKHHVFKAQSMNLSMKGN